MKDGDCGQGHKDKNKKTQRTRQKAWQMEIGGESFYIYIYKYGRLSTNNQEKKYQFWSILVVSFYRCTRGCCSEIVTGPVTAKWTHQYRWVYEYALQYVTVLKVEDENVDKLTYIFFHCIFYLLWWWISGSAKFAPFEWFFVGIIQGFEELWLKNLYLYQEPPEYTKFG